MSHPAAGTDPKKDIEILNRSLGGEYFGIAAYQAAMGTGLLEDGVRAVAEKFQGDHKQHAQRIQEAIIGLGVIRSKPRAGNSTPRSFLRHR